MSADTTPTTDDQENWFEMFQATVARFEEENDDLEAILAGDCGFHCYFATDGSDPTRGCKTAMFEAMSELFEEVSVDADIVEINHGEVTPDTVWASMKGQLFEHTYLSEQMLSAIEPRVKERVEKNLEARGER